jgi:hypothetical protein
MGTNTGTESHPRGKDTCKSSRPRVRPAIRLIWQPTSIHTQTTFRKLLGPSALDPSPQDPNPVISSTAGNLCGCVTMCYRVYRCVDLMYGRVDSGIYIYL